MAKTIGQIIKRLRKERNFTQEELAEKINVTPQAVSKWENGAGLPDISQIVPLASVFGVSIDTLFGIDGTTADAEASEIVKSADRLCEYGKVDTYLRAYDELASGLKKYPNNMMLLNNCVRLGLALSLPENGYLYAAERAAEIITETIRRANLIVSYSQNISDVLIARQALLILYSHDRNFHKATQEAMSFPIRTDLTLYSNLARVNMYMENYALETAYLCSDTDYALQALEDNVARLGNAYYNNGKYKEAIETYETFFAVMKAVFGNCSPPYHDFDSGDCYVLLARAYLAMDKEEKAMDSVENSITYYLNLYENNDGDRIERKTLMRSPWVQESELNTYICRSALKKRLLEKLSAAEIESLRENERFKALLTKVNAIPD